MEPQSAETPWAEIRSSVCMAKCAHATQASDSPPLRQCVLDSGMHVMFGHGPRLCVSVRACVRASGRARARACGHQTHTHTYTGFTCMHASLYVCVKQACLRACACIQYVALCAAWWLCVAVTAEPSMWEVERVRNVSVTVRSLEIAQGGVSTGLGLNIL